MLTMLHWTRWLEIFHLATSKDRVEKLAKINEEKKRGKKYKADAEGKSDEEGYFPSMGLCNFFTGKSLTVVRIIFGFLVSPKDIPSMLIVFIGTEALLIPLHLCCSCLILKDVPHKYKTKNAPRVYRMSVESVMCVDVLKTLADVVMLFGLRHLAAEFSKDVHFDPRIHPNVHFDPVSYYLASNCQCLYKFFANITNPTAGVALFILVHLTLDVIQQALSIFVNDIVKAMCPHEEKDPLVLELP